MKIFLLGGFLLMFASSVEGQTNQSPPFRVPLNHFYLVLDSKTYSDIENNQFMRREFAPSETRTTVRADRTYTGLYFYGINTYFEFFDVAKEHRRLGDSAIAFGVEEAGAAQKLQPRVNAAPPPLITRELNGAQIPWFWMLTPQSFSPVSGITTWVMEYNPRFLSEWHSEIKDGNQGISRKAVLHRYAAVLKERPAHPYLQEVIGITLAADDKVRARLKEVCEAYGYHSRVEGDVALLEGNDFMLRLIPETPLQYGIQQITLKVSGTQKKEFRFGAKSVLTFHGDGNATWTF